MHGYTLSPLMAQFAAAKAAGYELALAESLAESPALHTYLDRLDSNLLLDWSGESFWGLPQLRERILARYGYHAGPLAMSADMTAAMTAANVLITAGSAEAIFLTMAQTLQPGDEVIVETPGWQQPLRVAPALGAKVIAWPRREEDGWALDVERLETLITPRTRLIYFSNPNNPTGAITGVDDVRAIVQIAQSHGIRILSDEVYRGLEWDAEETPRVAEHDVLGISVGSVSKLFGMQGLRIGWIISQDQTWLEQVFAMRANTTELINVVGEAVANLALDARNFQIVSARNRALGRAARATLHTIIQATPQLTWHRPQGGYLGFARTQTTDGDTLARRLLAPPHRLWVIPGSVYAYPHHIRLGLGGAPTQVERALSRLATALDAMEPAPVRVQDESETHT